MGTLKASMSICLYKSLTSLLSEDPSEQIVLQKVFSPLSGSFLVTFIVESVIIEMLRTICRFKQIFLDSSPAATSQIVQFVPRERRFLNYLRVLLPFSQSILFCFYISTVLEIVQIRTEYTQHMNRKDEKKYNFKNLRYYLCQTTDFEGTANNEYQLIYSVSKSVYYRVNTW